jgi:hypothetical protein
MPWTTSQSSWRTPPSLVRDHGDRPVPIQQSAPIGTRSATGEAAFSRSLSAATGPIGALARPQGSGGSYRGVPGRVHGLDGLCLSGRRRQEASGVAGPGACLGRARLARDLRRLGIDGQVASLVAYHSRDEQETAPPAHPAGRSTPLLAPTEIVTMRDSVCPGLMTGSGHMPVATRERAMQPRERARAHRRHRPPGRVATPGKGMHAAGTTAR